MIDRQRKEWLRGAYQDRIREVALWLAEKQAQVAVVPSYEYEYLHELTAEDHIFLREETTRAIEGIIRERREVELRERHRLLIARTTVLAKMDSADRAYHLDQQQFDTLVGTALNDANVLVDDRGLLHDIILADLWPKLKKAHAELRKSVFTDLKSQHPGRISEDAVFAMDIGWARLLNRAAARIGSYPSEWKARLISGKEKLGCLVLSVDCDYSVPGCRSEVERLREEIRLASLATCEICGDRGRLRLAGYAKTVCDKHVGILGTLRDDDGTQADPYNWNDDDEYPAGAARLLQDMDPVRPRPAVHVLDEDSFGGAIIRQIEADLPVKAGREHELLFEFGGALAHAATRAVVKPEHLDRYVQEEVDSWSSVQPLSEDDKKFLHGYLRDLIDAEYERIRKAQAAELEHFTEDFGDGLDAMQEAQAAGLFEDLSGSPEDDDEIRH